MYLVGGGSFVNNVVFKITIELCSLVQRAFCTMVCAENPDTAITMCHKLWITQKEEEHSRA